MSGGSVTATLQSTALPDHVDYLDSTEFQITWWYADSAAGPWHEAGVSANKLYVTLNTPITVPRPEIVNLLGITSHPVYHSLIHLGCKSALPTEPEESEATTTQQVFDRIWTTFTERQVEKEDGTPLTYYSSTEFGAQLTAGLLQTGEGICSAWATLFLDTLRIQGLTYEDNYVSLYAPRYQTSGERFLIKEWSFISDPISNGVLGYQYLNIADFPLATFNTDGIVYHWKYPEYTYTSGIPGQGPVSKPAAMFNNHQLVLIDGVYYDPSYGKTYLSPESLNQEVIEGYCIPNWHVSVDEYEIGIDLNGDGNFEWIESDDGYPMRKNYFMDTPAMNVISY